MNNEQIEKLRLNHVQYIPIVDLKSSEIEESYEINWRVDKVKDEYFLVINIISFLNSENKMEACTIKKRVLSIEQIMKTIESLRNFRDSL